MSGVLTMLGTELSLRRWRQLMPLLAVVTLASAGLACGFGVIGDASSQIDGAFVRSRAADANLVVASSDATDARDVARHQPGVASIGESVDVVDAQLTGLNGVPLDADLVLRQLPPAGTVGAPVIVDGAAPLTVGELLMDAAFADDVGVDVGDDVTLTVGDTAVAATVNGLAYDFTDCLYPQCEPARAWMTSTAMSAAAIDAPASERTTLIPIDLDDGSDSATDIARFREVITTELDGLQIGGNDWPDTRPDLMAPATYFGAFLGVFGGFVLVSSMVVIAGSISARTTARRRAIGLYKSIGFTSRQMTASITLEHVTIAVIGCVVGNALAMALTPRLRLGPLEIIGGDAGWDPVIADSTVATVVTLVAFASVIPAWRAGRVEPATALADAPSRLSRRTLARGPVGIALARNSLASRPLRTALLIVAIGIAIVVATVSMSINRSVTNVVENPAIAGDPADIVVTPTTADPTSVIEQLDQTSGVASRYAFSDLEGSVADDRIHIRAVGEVSGAYPFVVGEGREPRRTGEAVAGYALLDEHGWKVGDQIVVRIDDTPTSLTLTGWYRETEDSGHILQVRLNDAEPAGRQVAWGVTVDDRHSVDAVADQLTSELAGAATVDIEVGDSSMVGPLRAALSLMTALVVAISLTHLGLSLTASERQRRHQSSVLKALGSGRRQQLIGAAWQGLLTAFIALAIALPLSWWTQAAIGDLLMRSIGVGPGVATGLPATDLAWVAVPLIALVVAASVAARHAAARTSNATSLAID